MTVGALKLSVLPLSLFQCLFRCSVLVSAKESDGSVDLAMQTLIRHLADKHLETLHGEEYRKRGKKKTKKAKPNTAGVDTSLKFTGVEEVGVDQGILAFGSFHVSNYWLISNFVCCQNFSGTFLC